MIRIKQLLLQLTILSKKDLHIFMISKIKSFAIFLSNKSISPKNRSLTGGSALK